MSGLGIRRALEATCPHCRKKIRVHDGEFPKTTYIQYSLFGGGYYIHKISITCPHCGTQFIKDARDMRKVLEADREEMQ